MATGSSNNKHDLPVTLSVLALGNDPTKLEELMKNNMQKLQGNIGLPGLVSMLKSMSSMSFKSGSVPSLKSFSAAVLREAVVLSQQKLLHSPDLSVIVAAAQKDRKALKRLLVIAASPALLASVQNIRVDSPWKQANALISGLLGPFVKARVAVPRLEATCAARLMEMLGRVCNISDVCGFAALLLQFRKRSLLGMPSFLDVLAAKLGIVASSPASSSDTGVVCRLCAKLLLVVDKKAPASSGDDELDKWVKGLEALAVDQFQSREHDSGAIHELLEKAVLDKFGNGVKDALGAGWLNTLLVRCTKIVWLGGKNIRCDTPSPASSVKSFAQSVYPLLGTAMRAKVDKLDMEDEDQPAAAMVSEKRASSISAEEESPKKKPRTGSRSKASAKEPAPQNKKKTLVVKVGEDKQMGETLVGTYVISGENHERNVYSRTEGEPVLLFYWDDRDGEDQAGWWFGPEVGGEEVWAYHCDSAVEPPELGWTMLYSGELDPTFKVEALQETGGKHVAPQEDVNSQHESCKIWLKDLDGGVGELLVYFDVLVAEFDADLQQIAAAKIEGKHADVLDYVDPSFWETLAVDNLAHKKLFAKGMKNL